MSDEHDNQKSESPESKQEKKEPALWDEYKLHIDLYKFYMDMALKANLFFYAIAGTILTVIYNPTRLQQGSGVPTPLPSLSALRIFLGIPFLMSILLGCVDVEQLNCST